jgi:hypothetical protein
LLLCNPDIQSDVWATPLHPHHQSSQHRSEFCLEQQKTPQPFVAKLNATPDAVSRLSPALADAILPFLNKFPDACFGLPFTFALMLAFAKATASKRAKP